MASNMGTRAMELDSVGTSIGDMMLQKLPQELYDLIERHFYQLVFTPGYFYPHGKPKDATESEITAYDRRHKARPMLLCLSTDVYRKYRERVYAENTCVWASGQNPLWPLIGTEFGALPTSLEVAFGPADRKCRVLSCVRPTRPRVFDPCIPPLEQLLIFKEELMLAWISKFCMVVGADSGPLTAITLDFRQCYDDDGEWQGARLVTEVLKDFSFILDCARKQTRVTILAPDDEKTVEIFRIFGIQT
ncbi:MAG: hypothetical protein LQ339_005385 [Xanthoria mediterranea]|nr:MAG: hypothetical protein LQ339_005385 [Xanthoria mediterranea]